MARLWADLAGPAAPAYKAVCRLADHPSAAVPFLADRLRPAAPLDAAAVARLIGQLDADSFDEREKAQAALEALGEPVRPRLQAALKAGPGMEARRRLTEALEGIAKGRLPPDRLREVRAVDVLERVGTPEARRLLERLAGGDPDARLTREAKASLERLPK